MVKVSQTADVGCGESVSVRGPPWGSGQSDGLECDSNGEMLALEGLGAGVVCSLGT